MRVDSHQHYWQYIPSDYQWINSDMNILQKDFLPKDIYTTLNQYQIDGVIAVQARQTEIETDFLLKLSEEYSWIYGVIGWINLLDPKLSDVLSNVKHDKLKGFRHLIQDEKEPSKFFENEQFNRGVKEILKEGYIYEILFHEKDISAAIQFCQRHDQSPLVIDHLGKPNISSSDPKEWLNQIRKIAELPHVYCKLSGLITEAKQNWVNEDIQPFIEIAIELFTPDRLMFGSDWPVCLLAGNYNDVYHLINDQINKLSISEQDFIMGKVAQKIYQI